jgi:hypothetical protein
LAVRFSFCRNDVIFWVGEQATTNVGILHFAQDDDVKRTTAAANANATADPCGMTNKEQTTATEAAPQRQKAGTF